ncbi:MBL fold metallo-hydrolase [Sphingomonas japonica]|uniref:L-ascorbate metabolism protein UlaG (Beta-lactamase superfamily) n=1 Tax=Sphingomonas japonica TaxID=511662 RepID=A0ABX0TW77_9SPHN|nr:MBL fold metallo-hydrolase [Sphingomonas japonica]NIJ22574.1 L-ascorbate metabolism protein UlaG (beta-lactamase superfamily) [Sphingomonas japonica]
MTRAVRRIGAVLLWLVIAACLAITIVPRFLDRVYYRGAASDHFDGARFFNPDGEDTAGVPGGGSRAGFLMRRATGQGDAPWPGRVEVQPSKPAERVEGDRMVATWIGHASVLVQTQGLNILTDPIWSETAGPLGLGPARTTVPGIAFDDLPPIDLVLVSHNHYDHLDLATLKRLWLRDRPTIVTSLGNDSVIGQAGVRSRALDWGEALAIRPGIGVAVTRNHHWSSRWFADRNRALWSSFVVTLPGGNLFFAGDTGFGDGRWPRQAREAGPIRFAILPIGAFRFTPGQLGTGSHIGPPDAVRVFDRLGQPFALPIHWGTFKLSSEARETPPRMLDLLMRCSGLDPRQFAARAVGQPVEVPKATTANRRLDEQRLASCARSDAVAALP